MQYAMRAHADWICPTWIHPYRRPSTTSSWMRLTIHRPTDRPTDRPISRLFVACSAKQAVGQSEMSSTNKKLSARGAGHQRKRPARRNEVWKELVASTSEEDEQDAHKATGNGAHTAGSSH
eukprot:6214111-Pleurochrysis_carterae.AAC.1